MMSDRDIAAAEGSNGDGAPMRSAAWRRRKDARRPEILARARELIEENGAANVSMARIAKAAGISEATVYNYFENKQDLVNQVLRDWALPFIERLTAELASLTELRSRLVIIATRYLRSIEQTPRLHRVFYTEIRWSDYRGSEIHRLNNLFVQSIVDAINEGIAGGEIRSETDTAMFRDMLFGGLEHIAQRTLFAGRSLDIENESARFVDLMLLGASPRLEAKTMPRDLARASVLTDGFEKSE